MTQEQNHRSPTSKRTVRPARNRPTLVTSSTPTDSVTEDQPEQVPSDTSQSVEARVDTRSPSPTGTRKLPGFFSRVGKSTQPETPEAEGAGELKDAPQASPRASTTARLGRAMRSKAFAPFAKTSVPDKKSEVNEPVKASPPA